MSVTVRKAQQLVLDFSLSILELLDKLSFVLVEHASFDYGLAVAFLTFQAHSLAFAVSTNPCWGLQPAGL